VPDVFDKLPDLEQEYALRQRWPELNTPAMLPVLKRIIMGL
jgi:hypothetical protein